MNISAAPPISFLSDVSVYDVDVDGQLIGTVRSPIERLAMRAIDSGTAEVSVDPDDQPAGGSAAIAIPILRGGHVVSVASLASKLLTDSRDDLVGVFEVWQPVGIYQELGLKNGFYGRMERFSAVSSFVRFEKGNGLPGQVWQQSSGVIHDDLPNHPGFLRAAGASAELLKTAIGIPVGSNSFHSAAVLISSGVSPLAMGCEVWQAEGDEFSLVSGAYVDDAAGWSLQPNTTLDSQAGLAGLAKAHGGAVICDDDEFLMAGRPENGPSRPAAALAIPFFHGDVLTSVSVLLF